MDVLKPELIWVDGRCYRFFESEAWINKNNMDSYVEEDYQADYTDEESSDFNIEIVPHGEAKLKHSFHVAKPFFPFIIGSKNAVRKRIEIETRTSIQVPKPEQDGDIVIIGSDRRGILSARHRIDLIIEVSRKKLSYTHFLSIPLNTDEIIKNFNSFKNDVIQKFGGDITGIDEIIFQKPSKLHLTIGMLTLLDEEERKQAVQTFMDCKQHIIDPFIEKHGLFTIEIKGVQSMNDNPGAVKILYGTVFTENNILQELFNQMVDYFAEKELMPNRTNDIKLHTTFMNIAYRKKDNNVTTDKNIYKKFDATQILNEYKDTLFGKAVLKEIHLSQLKTATETSYYQATAKITLGEEQP
ncbi:activating signal cointegrator 1 complex subunit 1 isoform X2 [Vespula squamosa]|uniref:Activating signal cointegrator 1 complex subunit 1 isoform X2 n=1 Tax=Vespula squamosa TaxID=30214 RepID=A0ABD2A572_VESSQ